MPTSTNVTNLKINELMEAQYDTAVQGGVIGANEISILTDVDDAIQVTTLPTASASEEGNIYQFIGTTDANYTNGYFYECVSDGQATPTYSWTQKEVQPSSGGLPSQTGNAGKFLTTDGTDASWSDKPLVNGTTSRDSLNILGSTVPAVGAVAIGVNSEIRSGAYGEYAIAIGYGAKGWWQGGVAIGYDTSATGVAIGYTAKSTSADSIAIGASTQATGQRSVAIGGTGVRATANFAVQLGGANQINSDANTFKVGNANGNYEIMSADGTIPTARLTKVNTTITLAVADWSSNTQTITVNGVTSTSLVFVSPDPSDAADYVAGGILCTAQAANSLTFTASTTPTNDIDVVVVAM